jgi:hypothetical protein
MSWEKFEIVDEYPLPLYKEDVEKIIESIDWIREDPDEWDVERYEEAFKQEIASFQEWDIFQYGWGGPHDYIYIWDKNSGRGIRIEPSEGFWHHLVNVFAEIVEAEGDCRNAEISDMLTQASTYRMSCQNCGNTWHV